MCYLCKIYDYSSLPVIDKSHHLLPEDRSIYIYLYPFNSYPKLLIVIIFVLMHGTNSVLLH